MKAFLTPASLKRSSHSVVLWYLNPPTLGFVQKLFPPNCWKTETHHLLESSPVLFAPKPAVPAAWTERRTQGRFTPPTEPDPSCIPIALFLEEVVLFHVCYDWDQSSKP